MDDISIYLRPTSYIDFENALIMDAARKLDNQRSNPAEKAANLFYFVRDKIKYNAYRYSLSPEYLQASRTLERGDGFCIQKAVLLVAIARAVGIPARLLFADIRNHLLPNKIVDMQGTDLLTHHGYCEMLIGDKWVKATPAFDLNTCEANRFVPVEFDGTQDAILHSHNQDGMLHIEYVRYHGHYDDVPLEGMINRCIEVYGEKITNIWKNAFWADACFG
jgi:transglutaminase-like putative cysteine protease